MRIGEVMTVREVIDHLRAGGLACVSAQVDQQGPEIDVALDAQRLLHDLEQRSEEERDDSTRFEPVTDTPGSLIQLR